MSNGVDLTYFSFQGKVSMGVRLEDGTPGPLYWCGDISAFEFGAEPNVEPFKESWSGQRGTGYEHDSGTDATLSATMTQINNRNLELVLGGERRSQATTAVAGKVISAEPLAVGQILLLGAYGVSNVEIVDSTAGAAKELVEGVNYKLSPAGGSIELLDISTGGTFAPPLKASFTPGDVEFVKLLANTSREFWVHFEGVNTAKPSRPKCGGDFYRFRPSPATLAMIHESRGEIPFEGSLLLDATKEADEDFGYFGRFYYMGN